MKTRPLVVLVIDDDENDLLFLRAAFRAAGVTSGLQTVCGGAEGIVYLKGEGAQADRVRFPYPDLILTDLKMPGLDGFAVLEFLRQRPERTVIPTIVLSGSQDNDDVKRAYMLGASAYHMKPSSPLELRQLVKILYEYWSLCDTPDKNAQGDRLASDSVNKLGNRYADAAPSPRPEGAV
jgi:CheY-like chemotaxis protein